MRPLLAALVLPLLAATTSAQQTWVVDPGPGGDFDSIQEANDSPAVQAFDLVLVHPGAPTYAGTTALTKPLRLQGVGATLPRIETLTVTSTGGFVASRLQIERLHINFVIGLVHVDRCVIGDPHGTDVLGTHAMVVANVPNALISRTLVHPGTGIGGGPAGLHAFNSKVRIVDSEIHGGHAKGNDFVGADGGRALQVSTSEVWIAGTSIIGGNGANAASGSQGHSGGAITFLYSNLDIRGSAHDVVRAGFVDPSSSTTTALAIDKEGTGSDAARVSGVTVIGPSEHVAHAEVMPYLALEGPLQPGAVAHANLYGEAGAFALWVASLLPTDLVLPTISHGHLWVDLGAPLHIDAFLLAGLDTPVGVRMFQPADPSLAGLAVHLAGFQWDPAGAWIATPATALVLGD